ncbi:MAG: ATP-binding protein, partial [Verrucomicrobia bacterium]|nr:ATP-binding protein [Verrucomicrobiota bacterium]
LCDLCSPVDRLTINVLGMHVINGKRAECPPISSRTPPSPIVRQAMEEGGQLILRDSAELARTDRLPFGDAACPSASLMVVPIRDGPTVIGALSIQSYARNAYDLHSLETLQALADHCAGALQRVRVQEERNESEARYRFSEAELRQSQKMEAIGQLAGGVAHEFNNLLTVIRGNTELVLTGDGQLSDERHKCLDQIIVASERAANLARQLLSFSRKQIMFPKLLDLSAVVGDFAKMLRRIIGEDIQLQCSFSAHLPIVKADVGMIEQVLINLVINARDVMTKGGRILITTESFHLDAAYVGAHPEARAGDFVCLSVTDSGTGIAPEHLPHIFEPFFTTKEVGKGSGLGLAAVYGIVQQHQGWIEVASQLGVGSTFRIFLPASQPLPAVVTAPEPVEIKPVGGSETVLVVEDDKAVRSLACRHLQKSGYRVQEAASGPQALELWRVHKAEIALVLTDLLMPGGISGRELVQQLLAEQPALKVIFMSGYSGEAFGNDTAFLRRTRARFLQKPYHLRTLLQTVRESLDEKPED